MGVSPTRFLLLVYRMPVRPNNRRVTVWRHLKKMGAVYLQQSVCVFPDEPAIRRDLGLVMARIEEAGGEYHLLPLRRLDPAEQEKLRGEFVAQATKHYDEIIENCDVNFRKEIEFEMFRENFTYEEAEEVRAEFEKIVQWYERVEARDWFEAPNKALAKQSIEASEKLLETFEARVYAVQLGAHAADVPGPAAERASASAPAEEA